VLKTKREGGISKGGRRPGREAPHSYEGTVWKKERCRRGQNQKGVSINIKKCAGQAFDVANQPNARQLACWGGRTGGG